MDLFNLSSVFEVCDVGRGNLVVCKSGIYKDLKCVVVVVVIIIIVVLVIVIVTTKPRNWS